MLQSLHIKRFQAHEDFRIDFDPYLTVITGVTDVGKSSILRALQWICLNQPSGDSFIRNGSGTAECVLEVDDRDIIRRRGKSINGYSIDGKDLEAFGQGIVPDEIASFLNLSPVSFQNQLDPHFWLSQTPGQVSKELNAIINLGMIDRTMAYLAAEARKAKSVVGVSESRLEASRSQREDLGWIVCCDVALKRLERLGSNLEAIQQRRSALLELLNKISEKEKQAKERIPQKETDRIEALRVTIEAKAVRLAQLRQLLDEIESTEAALAEHKRNKAEAEAALQKLTKGNNCPICERPFK